MNKFLYLFFFLFLSISSMEAQTMYSELAAKYAAQGDFEKAIELEKEALNLWVSVHGKKNKEYVNSLSYLAIYYSELGNYQEAIGLAIEALNIQETLYGKNNATYASILHFIANCNADLGNYQEAIRLENESLKIREVVVGKNHPDYAMALSNLAIYNGDAGNFEEAIRLASQVKDMAEEFFGKHCFEYVNSLFFLAQYNSKIGNRDVAIELCNEANKLLHSFFFNDPKYLTTLSQVAKFYSELNAYNEGLELNLELLELISNNLGKEHSYYASCVSNIAVDYIYLGDLEEALKYASLALNLREKTHGKEHEDYALSLSILAMCQSLKGNYLEAIRLTEESRNILYMIFGENHIDYIKCLINLAEYYSELNNYNLAIQYNKKAYEIAIKLYGQISSEIIQIKQNLSKYYIFCGDYNNGIKIGFETLNLILKTQGNKNINYATLLGNLSFAYFELGVNDKAINLASESLNILKEIIGENHIDYATMSHNLSGYYYAAGDLNKAIETEKHSLKIRESALGSSHPYYASSLGNLSTYYFILGNNEEALFYNAKALDVLAQTLGKSHIYYATALNNRALIYGFMGNYNQALEMSELAADLIKENLGDHHNKYLNYLIWLAYLYEELRDTLKLEETGIKIYTGLHSEIISTFSFLPKLDKIKYWANRGFWFNEVLPSYTYNLESNQFKEIAYNASLLSKGILLNSEIEFDKFLAETGKPELVEKYNEIRSLRLQLNKLYEKPVAERGVDTDSLERVANNLERELMYESKEFGDYTRNLSITWQDVQKGLKQKDVAVEFVSFPLNQDSTMYMAYVLKPEMDSPQMVKLFEEKNLASLTSVDNPAEIYNKVEASNLIWRKLEPYLEGCENVYFAPDGILHQTAIGYLPDFNGEGMMADRYNLHRLSSTRQLAVRQDRIESTSAAVYGGIVYDTDVDSMKAESRKYMQEKEEGVFLAQRGFNPFINYADILNTRLGVRYLDGTRIEAEEVNQSLLDNNYQTQLVVGTRATEESFKNLSGKGNGIIHIATHGFYWQEDEADRMARSNERLMFMSTLNDNGPRYVEDKALTRSGLFMSGVNNILRGDTIPEGVDDGILTAQEIAQMNLRGTDLVVLSACQTGLGEISGDGVFGLQRGFKKAGANSLLMSLWKVDDDATQRLMEAFYRNLMSGQTKQQALRNAQKSVLDDGFDDPKFWAAFILLDGLN